HAAPRRGASDREVLTMAKKLQETAADLAKEAQDAAADLTKELQDTAADLTKQARKQALDALGANESHLWRNLGWLLLGVGLGALVAYMLDPDRGRRRQALVRDQVVHATKVVQREVPKRIRYTQGQLQGVRHDLGLDQSGKDGPAPDDVDSPGWEEQH